MDNRSSHTDQRFEGAHDQIFARLHQHLNGDIVRNLLSLDQPAHEVIVKLAGRGESDLDLLEAELDQQRPHPLLLHDIHRLQQRLVAITQVDTGPLWRLGEAATGPLPVRQVDRSNRTVFAMVKLAHGTLLTKMGIGSAPTTTEALSNGTSTGTS